jgi:hypothetical protein
MRTFQFFAGFFPAAWPRRVARLRVPDRRRCAPLDPNAPNAPANEDDITQAGRSVSGPNAQALMDALQGNLPRP